MTDKADPKDYARSSVTQVITLSATILGISITFAKNFSTTYVPGLLLWSWILYVLSILMGILCLSALTGMAMVGKSIKASPLSWLWLLELLAFFTATLFFMIMALQVY